jgi:hypothetical protein
VRWCSAAVAVAAAAAGVAGAHNSMSKSSGSSSWKQFLKCQMQQQAMGSGAWCFNCVEVPCGRRCGTGAALLCGVTLQGFAVCVETEGGNRSSRR